MPERERESERASKKKRPLAEALPRTVNTFFSRLTFFQ